MRLIWSGSVRDGGTTWQHPLSAMVRMAMMAVPEMSRPYPRQRGKLGAVREFMCSYLLWKSIRVNLLFAPLKFVPRFSNREIRSERIAADLCANFQGGGVQIDCRAYTVKSLR